MAITAADISVAVNGDIRWEDAGAGDGPYTVLELHRYLQDLADDASASGDDLVDITSSTPSERSTDNIITLLGTYNIDAELAQHLYDGSITQSSGDEVYSGLIVVGSVYSSTTLMVIQNNALYDDGVHTPATPFWGTDLNVDATQNILMQCMIKSRTGGADIDGKKVRVQARELGDTYAEFSVTLGLGNQIAAIFTTQDLNNQTASGTIAGWTDITNTSEGYNTLDILNGSGAVPYYSLWDRDIYTINQLYERAKYLQRRGNTTVDLYGLDGELFRGITHEVNLNTGGTNSGTFDAYEAVSWTGGTGQMLAINNTTAASATKLWIQLLTGSAPGVGVLITGTSSSATATTTAATATTQRTIAPCFLGQSTGSALIGAYGIGVEALDLTVSDKLFDLTNTLQTPPNNVTFTVSGIVSGEDYVLVGPESGSTFETAQLTLTTTLDGATETAIVVDEAIPADTPATGTIRVQLDDLTLRKIAYTSWDTSTFTIAETDFSGALAATAANEIMISYIDKLADATSATFTAPFNATRSLYVRIRDGGASPIKTYESVSSLTSSGGSVTAIRTSDA